MLPPLSGEQKMWYILKGYTINVDVFGNREWCLNGQLHREDGPACEYAGGDRHWYLNGQHHREDGPAVEYAGGDRHWYRYGEYHREDGPACEYANGDRYWYLNDQNMTEEKHRELTQKKMANIG